MRNYIFIFLYSMMLLIASCQSSSNKDNADLDSEISDFDFEQMPEEDISLIKLKVNNVVVGVNYFDISNFDFSRRYFVEMNYSIEMTETVITQKQFKELLGYDALIWKDDGSVDNPYPQDCLDRCPAFANWNEAALLANKLSVKNNLPECFDCHECTPDTDSFCIFGQWEYKNELQCILKPTYQKLQDCPGYRLPTNAEWEYAARGGTTSAYYNGTNDDFHDIAWFGYNSGGRIHQVGQKLPNSFKLYDMLGNLDQLVYDDSHFPSQALNEIIIDPSDLAVGSDCYTRGGGYGTQQIYTNVGIRDVMCVKSDGGYAIRLARTITKPINAPDDPVPYTKEEVVEKTLPSPYGCMAPQGYSVDVPTLSWVNPFPNPGFTSPMSLVDGMPFYYTYGGAVYWPSRIPWTDRLYPQSQGAVSPLAAVSAWGKLWVGNNSGGIWEANTGEGMWETVVEMSGSAPYSLLYDAKNDRLVGWYFCDLFLRYADGGSDIRHFYVDLPSEQYHVDNHACTLDGQTTSVKGLLGTFKGEVYQSTKIVKYDKRKASRPYHLQAALFKLVGEEFKHVCTIPLPDIQDRNEVATWTAKPYDDGDRLLLAGIPGQIWQYDGNNCSKIYDSQTIGVGNVAQSLAKINAALYVMTKDKVYRLEGDALTEELSIAASPGSSLANMAVDAEKNILYVGGAKGVTFPDYSQISAPYLAAKISGKWETLSRDIKEADKQFNHLTAVSIGKNGKGAAGGYFGKDTEGALLRFDGNDWYPWAGADAKKYNIVSVYTNDGDNVWFATRREIFRASDKDGIVKESIPYTKGRYFNALIGDKNADEFYAVGEWGLLWKHTKEGWVDLNVDTTLSMLGGAVYKGELYLSADESHLGPGKRLFILKNNQLVELVVPSFVEENIGRSNPVYDLTGIDYVFKSIFLTVDLNNRLWMARDDGIWLFKDADQSWREIAGPFTLRDVLNLATSAFAPCGEGVCKTGIVNVSGMAEDSYIDIVRPGKEDPNKFELLRRQFTYSQSAQPLAADVINKDRTVFVGSFGEIIEYGKWLPMPCAIPDALKPPLTEYADNFNYDAFYGECKSTNQQAIPQCAGGECFIPEGDFCIGATKEADLYGFSQAGYYPMQNKHLQSFYIDEKFVTRGEYAEFINGQPASDLPLYLIFEPTSDYYKQVYLINISDQNIISATSPDLSVDFATKDGAVAYCASIGKRLCKAAEWEAACRARDDYPFPENNQLNLPDGINPLDVVSDFGVRGMGILHYEYVDEDYSHDSLRTSVTNHSSMSLPMVKGGTSVLEMTCWSRSEPYYPLHPMNLGFRCCRD